jgi:hypothetical protein
MDIHRSVNVRRLGLAASIAFTAGLVTAGPAVAASSVSPSDPALVANNTLIVSGTNDADQITLSVDPGDPNSLLVDFAGASPAETFDRTTFNAIAVFLRDGDDQFTAGVGIPDEVMTLDAGRGDDRIVTADGSDLILAGGGRDTVNSGSGNDFIFAGSGNDAVDGDAGSDVAFLESGQDSFKWDPGDGSDVIEGGDSIDTLDFNGSDGAEIMSLSPDGQRSVFLRDLGNIRMDMSDVELLDLTALGGADTVTVNDMSGTDFRHANVDLSVPAGGDDATDVVTVNGTDQDDQLRARANDVRITVAGLDSDTRITGMEPTDQLRINSLDGNDTVRVDRDVPPLIDVAVDLGAGQL